MGVRIEGAREASQNIAGIAVRLRDPSPALKAEADQLLADARSSIADRVEPDGTAWPEPKKTTDRRDGSRARPRSSTARAQGRSTGRLGRSGRAAASGDTATVEFTAPYAGHVQYGTEDMEARRYLPFTGGEADEGWLAGVMRRIAAWVMGGRRG